jgi:hypothetical protein
MADTDTPTIAAAARRQGIGDFDIAYAHEAMARAYRVLGDEAESTAHAEQAHRATAGIADSGDREHAMEDIAELL